LDLVRSHPRNPEKSQPRYDFFRRMHEVFTGGLKLTAAEEKDLGKYADLTAYGALLSGADATDAEFAPLLVEWLRVDWAKTHRQMERSREVAWPYPGPISTVACALVARRQTTPVLPDDVARFVPGAVVESARR
jgi:hypothetical protein